MRHSPARRQGVFFKTLLLQTIVLSKGENDHEERNMSEMKTDYAGMAHKEIAEMNGKRGLVAAELEACEGEGGS